METIFPLLFFKDINQIKFYTNKNIIMYINNIFTPTNMPFSNR